MGPDSFPMSLSMYSQLPFRNLFYLCLYQSSVKNLGISKFAKLFAYFSHLRFQFVKSMHMAHINYACYNMPNSKGPDYMYGQSDLTVSV